MDNLGNKIKKERIKNNLKQSELAKILCVSEKTISSWENNRTLPDLNMIIVFCHTVTVTDRQFGMI